MTTTATFTKAIKYNRAGRDYDAYLDGDYKGSFPTHHAAEVALDQIVYDILEDTRVLDADQGALADELVVVSEPVPTTGRCEDATYYTVGVSYRLMSLAYRLHNECDYGTDCQGAFADSAPSWYGTEMASLDLPTAAIAELR